MDDIDFDELLPWMDRMDSELTQEECVLPDGKAESCCSDRDGTGSSSAPRHEKQTSGFQKIERVALQCEAGALCTTDDIVTNTRYGIRFRTSLDHVFSRCGRRPVYTQTVAEVEEMMRNCHRIDDCKVRKREVNRLSALRSRKIRKIQMDAQMDIIKKLQAALRDFMEQHFVVVRHVSCIVEKGREGNIDTMEYDDAVEKLGDIFESAASRTSELCGSGILSCPLHVSPTHEM